MGRCFEDIAETPNLPKADNREKRPDAQHFTKQSSGAWSLLAPKLAEAAKEVREGLVKTHPPTKPQGIRR